MQDEHEAQAATDAIAALYALPDDDAVDNRTLGQIYRDTAEARWSRPTSAQNSLSIQARIGVDTLSIACRPDLAARPLAERLDAVRRQEVLPAHIKVAVRVWKSQGKKPRHINRRLVCLSAMGFRVRGNYQRVPKSLKWWLKPDDQAKLVNQLAVYGDQEFIDYVEWATSTGFRVEETLRLTRSNFVVERNGRVLVTVPGLKTYDAQATLPMSTEAVAVFHRRLGAAAEPGTPLFVSPYWKLAEKWRGYRHIIGAGAIPDATLKAFRRVSARKLHADKAMPLDLVKTYLRHENIETTMGYLRLTGGYSTDEFAKYL